ncbi:BTB/POZ and MATH domain-containing protein 2 [Brachypodium distachyon]|uniref:BTB domain-containing protein n=1 Tax=Brachypodium distachyon TaxID=15368 RepID=A0A0Q3FH87_BRADI|nr:BTB/POZ and MATH domain-containing protein 2 [Brachypodium distachyon]KQJ99039.1 hypothetical protein BRADI_3g40693v3 [Brachypodium distachyon]|eukprot:XP_024317944.1 BTB/POZ and MATH domain-containing protein 2 [Brachypodium distachyon]
MADPSFTELKLDYLEFKNHGLGNPISEYISAGHYTWRIDCHYTEDDEGDCINLYLFLRSKLKTFDGIFEAFLVCKNGAPSSRAKRSVLNVDTKYTNCDTVSWRGEILVKPSLLESRYVTNGAITLICGIVSLRGNWSITVPASEMGNQFGSLLDSPDGTDLSFSVGGETFRAHRTVLAARSPVFRAMLFGSMAEANMSRITLSPDDIDLETFRAVLRFVYTDRPPVEERFGWSLKTTEHFQRVLAAADRYDLGRLKLMCAQKLWETVSAETVATTLGCAEMHGCPELKSRCLDFFMEKEIFKKAVLTEGYLWLMQSLPSVIDEIKARVEALIVF